MTERMIQANGVELCTEAFGAPTDPAILLVMGTGASMLWWDERFCRLLSDTGRFVMRYDHRDTGRSITYEPDRPRYTGSDMEADAVGVLDAYGVRSGHVVGVSAVARSRSSSHRTSQTAFGPLCSSARLPRRRVIEAFRRRPRSSDALLPRPTSTGRSPSR